MPSDPSRYGDDILSRRSHSPALQDSSSSQSATPIVVLLLLPLHQQLFRIKKLVMMAPLRCCTFNCRGWNSSISTLKNHIDSLDLCFVQDHWLHKDHLNKIRDISADFLSVSVSRMDSTSLLCGRPYGGCSILYRKSFSSCITPLVTCSDRFCAIKILDSTVLSLLMVSLYMPSECTPSAFNEYLNTLGELEGFLESQQCDVSILVGDFNVDFDRGGSLAKLLADFLSELYMCACDLSFRGLINYTYERDDR